jgi:plastocyanin
MILRACIGLALMLGASAAEAGTVVLTVRDVAGAPVAGAVVALNNLAQGAGQAAARAAAKPVVLDQIDEEFVPDVLVVPTGGQVVFKNSDQTRHHIYSFRQPKRFELQLAPGEISAPVTFDQSGVVALGCNIHDHMRAWLYVTEARFVARTGPDGVATFTDVPSGAWEAKTWHPRVPPGAPEPSQAIRLDADGKFSAAFVLPLRATVGPARDPERARY